MRLLGGSDGLARIQPDSLVDFHTGHDANYRVAPGMPAPAETYFLVRCGLRATLRLNCVLVV